MLFMLFTAFVNSFLSEHSSEEQQQKGIDKR
jgi:hypothetical protein